MYNVSSGDSLAKKTGTIIVRRLVRICVIVYLEHSLPDGIVLGFQILSGGGCEMIHDHLRHFF